MAEFPIPSSNIHHSASAKTLTLDPPFNLLKNTDIVKISNLSKNVNIYDSRDPRHHTLFIRQADQTQAFDINISDGVLSYVVDAGMEDSDDIQIIVNDYTTPVTVTNLNMLGLSDVLSVFTTKAVAKSTTELGDTAYDLRNVSYAKIYIKVAGSTNFTVNIRESHDVSGSVKPLLSTTTLNATTLAEDDITIEHCPNYVFFDLINNDPDNDAVIDISIQRTVSSDIVRPYSDILTVYTAQSVAPNTTLALSSAQDIRGAAYVIPYIKNSGSTDLTVNLYGSPTPTGTIKPFIRSYHLDTTVTDAGTSLEKCSNYLFFEIKNDDDTNAAIVDISVQRG